MEEVTYHFTFSRNWRHIQAWIPLIENSSQQKELLESSLYLKSPLVVLTIYCIYYMIAIGRLSWITDAKFLSKIIWCKRLVYWQLATVTFSDFVIDQLVEFGLFLVIMIGISKLKLSILVLDWTFCYQRSAKLPAVSTLLIHGWLLNSMLNMLCLRILTWVIWLVLNHCSFLALWFSRLVI